MSGFISRGIPLPSIYITDYKHWKEMGDYPFNPTYWPGPAAMVKNFSSLKDDGVNGTRIMVSAWPFFGLNSRSTATGGVVKKQYVVLQNGSGVVGLMLYAHRVATSATRPAPFRA
jgi:alpha-D-xyloside xylohydrolase